MSVGFCTTVMNRRWQLERTIAANLARLRGTGSFLAVVDFNSQDVVEELVLDLLPFVEDGTLLFFRTEEPRYFHTSQAKNLAHRLALSRHPEILFNLDADNYLGGSTLALAERVLREPPEACLHNWSTADDDGSFGRIGLRAATWAALGGYDEALLPGAWEDVDLLARCRAAGLRYVLERRGVPLPIPNSMAMKLANLPPAPEVAGVDGEDDFLRHNELCKQNLIISLGRPARLSLSEQRRFTGMLNLREPLTL